nr:LytTR family DNA-binding domain-containing protein [Microbacterium amylolyticum]
MKKRERRTLLFQADGVHHRIDVDSIRYLESAGHRVLIHTLTDTHSVVSSLKAMEAELDPASFQRCNSGYLVNLRHVTAVDQSVCHVRGGTQLQISRPKRKVFLAALAEHIGALGS